MLKVGDKLPAGTLSEFIEVEGNGCSIGPNGVDLIKATAGKKIAIFALPGAYTPTCSVQHVPGYVTKAAELKAAGIDEIWCIAVNDAFVMGAWAKQSGAEGKITMLADGNCLYTKELGLELDASGFGMGQRGQRFALIVENGVAKHVFIEAPMEFKVSAAENILANL